MSGRTALLKIDKEKAKTETKKEKIEKQIQSEQPKCKYTLDQVIEIQDEMELAPIEREKKMLKYFKQYLIETYKSEE